MKCSEIFYADFDSTKTIDTTAIKALPEILRRKKSKRRKKK